MRSLKWIVVIVAVLYWTAAAVAITNGTPDNARHPNVGTILFVDPTTRALTQVCTGTLIGPRWFLTAGHCVAFLMQRGVTQMWITFDPVFGPSPNLFSAGRMTLNPAFPGTQSDPEDLGMVVLDAPVIGITPAALPPLGLLDRLFAEGQLRNTLFTIVGYGAADTVFGTGAPDPNENRGTRRFATEGFDALEPNLLRLNQNAVFAYGGSNHGDSGGPNFLGAADTETSIVAGITIGGDPWGLSQNVAYRLDTPEARAFLGQFVLLP